MKSSIIKFIIIFHHLLGSHHFRITILPSNELMQDMLSKLAEFNKKFLQEFS